MPVNQIGLHNEKVKNMRKITVDNDVVGHDTEINSVVSSTAEKIRQQFGVKVDPNSSQEKFYIATPIIPESRKNIVVTNEGLADVITAKYYWSHSFTSEYFEDNSVDVKVGESKVLVAPSNPLYYSKVVIFNNTKSVAFVTVREK
ncbi:JHE-like toxin PirA [Photorhabdus laumondii subsp. laumondii]|uniref:Photorhabdus luminescens subsp. laumondii TTO1 complete genome segment 15/17 n=2 Tax=Photorhabdus laumondii subsp. laumondii TaxID=141679 RepID=Q7MZ61_PHOLL|nr:MULTISPECIES: hypothetical protein [Photorhabdus]AWK43974.1 hypothetical protein A4R40_21980 [Photorhabdus laumondii subsp. laumondii]AXG44653.1 JHE-like toxin PirA [Photorhabdus laumondii subsp. laumondii]AXG49289.1 JHE-like toxin PirA [Photorhabdus laumondii subsp. laumondii]KTL62449.1 hypothetical protein AA106_20405 [Photorhabdus laumondii subsp. laumondii]MCC8386339.1 JHE-like toxin PirA [Photorhabdus laumondii]